MSISEPIQLTVGCLALQGGFHEHADLTRIAAKNLAAHLSLKTTFVRTERELAECDALIIPGGESTTMMLLAKNNGLLPSLRQFVDSKPVWGTCAGMIVLSKSIYRDSGDDKPEQESIGGVDVSVVRNQYGRQLASFEHDLDFQGIRDSHDPFNAVFIRAPIVHHLLTSDSQQPPQVLATVPLEKLPKSKVGSPELGPDAHIVAIRQGDKLVTSFHPELSSDPRIHEYFLQEIVLPSMKRNRG